jgi:AcrR family transcriptional regulator
MAPARKPKPYHHGNLQTVLLAAAERELATSGIEGFSLRGVAKRAGVSHAAPAHHFGDVNGLLTALAAVGFERFVAAQRARQEQAAKDPLSQLVASGLGYIDFARAHPALFRLMFSSDRPDHANPRLREFAEAAMAALIRDVRAVHGKTDAAAEIATAWAVAHGLADLIIAGRLKHVLNLPPAAQERALADILRHAIAPR